MSQKIHTLSASGDAENSTTNSRIPAQGAIRSNSLAHRARIRGNANWPQGPTGRPFASSWASSVSAWHCAAITASKSVSATCGIKIEQSARWARLFERMARWAGGMPRLPARLSPRAQVSAKETLGTRRERRREVEIVFDRAVDAFDDQRADRKARRPHGTFRACLAGSITLDRDHFPIRKQRHIKSHRLFGVALKHEKRLHAGLHGHGSCKQSPMLMVRPPWIAMFVLS